MMIDDHSSSIYNSGTCTNYEGAFQKSLLARILAVNFKCIGLVILY